MPKTINSPLSEGKHEYATQTRQRLLDIKHSLMFLPNWSKSPIIYRDLPHLNKSQHKLPQFRLPKPPPNLRHTPPNFQQTSTTQKRKQTEIYFLLVISRRFTALLGQITGISQLKYLLSRPSKALPCLASSR